MLSITIQNDQGYEQLLNFNAHRLRYYTKFAPRLISIAEVSSERQRNTIKNQITLAIRNGNCIMDGLLLKPRLNIKIVETIPNREVDVDQATLCIISR